MSQYQDVMREALEQPAFVAGSDQCHAAVQERVDQLVLEALKMAGEYKGTELWLLFGAGPLVDKIAAGSCDDADALAWAISYASEAILRIAMASLD